MKNLNNTDVELQDGDVGSLLALVKELRLKLDDLFARLMRDSLTGAYNHAFLQSLIEHYNKPSMSLKNKNAEEHLVVVLIDIDEFKGINDKHGHLMGNKFLCKVAKLLHFCCRRRDYVIRFGGDEFLMIFPGLTKKNTTIVVKRLMDKLNKVSMPVQFSFGVASGVAKDILTLIKESDQNMYYQKTSKIKQNLMKA